MQTLLTFVHALSPLHAGIGQGAGVIDLPVARETATGLPFLPGSSLKGALRTRSNGSTTAEIFGADPSDLEKNARASSVLFTDQRLFLLPVRSIAGTFAWVTSPYTLYRFLRDVREAQLSPPALDIPSLEEKACLVTQRTKLFVHLDEKQVGEQKKGMIYLEDFDLEGTKDEKFDAWAAWLAAQVFGSDRTWGRLLLERLCLVSDDLFNFMSQHSTEVTARIRLQDESKTVEDGGLWYEETLPTESMLSGLLVIAPAKEIQKRLDDQQIATIIQGLVSTPLQLGGKATTGRGLCHVQIVAGKRA